MQMVPLGLIFALMFLGVAVEANPVPASYLSFPLLKGTGMGSDGLPTYTGDNSAENCPKELRFVCSECPARNCDSYWRQRPSEFPKGKRPCKAVGSGDRQACHAAPAAHVTDEWLGAVNDTVSSGDVVESMASMSRDEILKRALGWLVNNFEYKTNWDTPTLPKWNLEGCAENTPSSCPRRSSKYPGYRYKSDCSGFVAMAWKSDIFSPTPEHFTKNDLATQLPSCNALCAGDAIVRWEGGGYNHIVLFRQWDAVGNTFSGWQMGGEVGKVNHFTGRIGSKDKCVRRPNVQASPACPPKPNDLIV